MAKEDLPDVDPYEDDDKPAPDEWDDSKEKPTDSNGRPYNPYQGSQSPTEGRCNCLLSNWEERYDEPRYCTALPKKYFMPDGSEFCKNHVSRENLMKNANQLMKHGAFAKNYVRVFGNLDTFEQIEVTQVFNNLVTDSVYDFESETVQWTFEVEDEDIETDQIEQEIKIPTSKMAPAKALWLAALDLAKMTRMNTIMFKDNLEHEKTITYTENGEEITEMDEHYMNLAYSRLASDYRKFLENGGIKVDIDGDKININDAEIEYITELDVSTEESTPEAKKMTDDTDFPLNEAFEDE